MQQQAQANERQETDAPSQPHRPLLGGMSTPHEQSKRREYALSAGGAAMLCCIRPKLPGVRGDGGARTLALGVYQSATDVG